MLSSTKRAINYQTELPATHSAQRGRRVDPGHITSAAMSTPTLPHETSALEDMLERPDFAEILTAPLNDSDAATLRLLNRSTAKSNTLCAGLTDRMLAKVVRHGLLLITPNQMQHFEERARCHIKQKDDSGPEGQDGASTTSILGMTVGVSGMVTSIAASCVVFGGQGLVLGAVTGPVGMLAGAAAGVMVGKATEFSRYLATIGLARHRARVSEQQFQTSWGKASVEHPDFSPVVSDHLSSTDRHDALSCLLQQDASHRKRLHAIMKEHGSGPFYDRAEAVLKAPAFMSLSVKPEE